MSKKKNNEAKSIAEPSKLSKKLYERTGLPDNYIDETFLISLRKNGISKILHLFSD